ncbi:phage tail terminator-like protein [Pelagerythrobacter marinus]|uniref:phage tail terminator-like protein n=1 Tax=Pelagerythrobacter marinus TaxID=538382 RepID=UPI002AC8F139|nr:phage tail terminator-like protein [Pelagerythrobacter marinus]WPZ05662.1 phage tail terminator-like protein [Pelagerythrobacter marinus]
MPSIETTDWLALKSRVDTLVTDPAMPVFEPGAIVTPPKDGSNNPLPFILLSDTANDPERVGISRRGAAGVDHIRTGTLILTVQWPIARAVSHTQLKEIAGQIAAHFPADTCMSFGPSRLRVTQDAAALQPYIDGAYRVAVVRAFWSSM